MLIYEVNNIKPTLEQKSDEMAWNAADVGSCKAGVIVKFISCISSVSAVAVKNSTLLFIKCC